MRTARPLGRGMEWLGSKGTVTKVSEAKRWAEGRSYIRKAARGRWLEWLAEEGAYQQGGGADGSGQSVPLSRESSTLGSEGGTVESCIGQADTANDSPDPVLSEEVQMSQSDVGNAPRLGGGTQSEREKQEDERPTTRAAAKTREIEGPRGQGQTNGRGKVVGEKGTTRRPTGPRQGAALCRDTPPPPPPTPTPTPTPLYP